MNSISYTCTAMNGLNKIGKLRPEADGYYRVILGALNVYNSSGALYPYGPAKALFERNGSLMRRIERGALRAENGHPVREPVWNDEQYAQRILTIREDRVCAHIKQIDLVTEGYVDKQGRPFIAIEGLIAPAGELGYVVEKALANPNENIAFSIRSFTDDVRTFSGWVKNLRHIVTWDFVGEPGIGVAEKYFSPSLEALDEQHFNRGTLERAFRTNTAVGIGMESAKMNADELFHSLGWTATSESMPTYLKW